MAFRWFSGALSIVSCHIKVYYYINLAHSFWLFLSRMKRFWIVGSYGPHCTHFHSMKYTIPRTKTSLISSKFNYVSYGNFVFEMKHSNHWSVRYTLCSCSYSLGTIPYWIQTAYICNPNFSKTVATVSLFSWLLKILLEKALDDIRVHNNLIEILDKGQKFVGLCSMQPFVHSKV